MRTICSLFLILALTSCRNDRYLMFGDTGSLQFGPAPGRIYMTSFDFADTLKRYSFVHQSIDAQQDTVFFDLYALGGPRDYDRSYTLKQVQTGLGENAVAGVHYKPFDDASLQETYVIKAGTVHTLTPVVLLRDASLKEKNVLLQFMVTENEWFTTGEPDKLWRRVEIADRLIQPDAWDARTSTLFWGKYSQVKHEHMIRWTGQPWDDEFMAPMNSGASVDGLYWKNKLKVALVDFNKDRPTPLVDEDGDLVLFP